MLEVFEAAVLATVALGFALVVFALRRISHNLYRQHMETLTALAAKADSKESPQSEAKIEPEVSPQVIATTSAYSPLNEFVSPIALKSKHISGGARLFLDRYEMVKSISFDSAPVIVEVGVAMGEFSKFLMETHSPSKFFGVDSFDLHTLDNLWGKPPAMYFGDDTHEEYFRKNLAQFRGVHVLTGDSSSKISTLPDDSIDLLYLDADHTFPGVLKDLQSLTSKMKSGGLLICNDYTLWDPLAGAPFGVVQAVNHFVNDGGWVVEGFCLQQQMFCDIMLRKI